MMHGLRTEFEYFQCVSCGCLQITEVPDDLTRYYHDGYYSFSEGIRSKFNGLGGFFRRCSVRYSIFKRGFLNYLGHLIFPYHRYDLFRGLRVTERSAILDVGCGNGMKFLFPLAEAGFTNLSGCDPFLESDIHYANGLRIQKSDIEGMSGKWDFITFHHSFEHVLNPSEVLAKIAGLLSEEGVCIVRTPTVSSYAWDTFGVDWVQLDAPRHIFIQSRKSLAYIAHQHGMEVFRAVDDSTHFQFVGSEKYLRNIPLRQKEKIGFLGYFRYKLKKYKFKRRAKELNKDLRGDQSIFYLRRKP